MKVILHLTKNCNLRCRYCYAPEKVDEPMSLEVAQKAIDLAIETGKTSACVSFFGGEPLLLFDRMQELTAYAEARGEESGTAMYFRLSTNGTLFTEESLAFCRDHKILFALSLDGDREAHNAQRVFPDGTGSFDVLDAKLPMILHYNPYTVVTSVITPPTVGRLYESMEYLWSRGLRYVVHQLDYTHPDWTPAHFETLAESYRKLGAFYLDRMRAGERFHMGLFDDKLKSHTREPIRYGAICDFGARKVSVAPDGTIFPCVQFVSDRDDAKRYAIGHVESGFTPRRQELITLNKRPRRPCDSCAFLGRCANYCGCMSWQLTGHVLEVPPILCSHERMLIPIADELGTRLWEERNPTFLNKHYKHLHQMIDPQSRYAFD